MRRQKLVISAVGLVVLFIAALTLKPHSRAIADTTSHIVDWAIPAWGISGTYVMSMVPSRDGTLVTYTVADSATGAILSTSTVPQGTPVGDGLLRFPPAEINPPGPDGSHSFVKQITSIYGTSVSVYITEH